MITFGVKELIIAQTLRFLYSLKNFEEKNNDHESSIHDMKNIPSKTMINGFGQM